MTPQDAPFVPNDPEADELDRFLDALVAGQVPAYSDLPASLAATAHGVQRLDDTHVAPRLSPNESQRIWEDLMQSHTASPALPFPGPLSGTGPSRPDSRLYPPGRHQEARIRLVQSADAARLPAPVLSGRQRDRTLRQRWNRHGWPIVELLSAAVLLIGLVSVLIGGNGGNDDGGRPAVLPPLAGVGTATPTTAPDEVAALPDPGQTGVMPGPGLTGDPALVWRVPIQEVTSDLFVSDGTIVRAHFSDQVPADITTTNPWTIDALSARAGTPIWSATVEAAGVQIGGIWQGTIVLVATGENAPVTIDGEAIGQANQGHVIGLDLATGDIQWSTELVNAAAGTPTVIVPTVADGTAYIPTSLGELFSVDLIDGSINWQMAIEDGTLPDPERRGFSRAAVADGTVAVYSSASNSVVTFDAATGAPGWSLQVNEPAVLGTPVAGLDVILEPAPSVSGPAIADGKVFVSIGAYSGDAAQSLMAIDLASGDVLWTADLGAIDLSDVNRQRGVSQPYVAEDAVIVSIGGSDGNRLVAFAPDTGDQMWEHHLSDGQSAALSIVGDTAYAARDDGTLTGIDVGSGDERWSVTTGGALHGAPFVVDGMLFQPSNDGQLYAVGEGGAVAATPDAATDISGLPACDVAPRAEPDMMPAGGPFSPPDPATLGEPAATLAEPVYAGSDDDRFATAPTLAWDDLPVGTPVDAETTAAITEIVDGITACARAGSDSQVAAWFSEDFFLRPYTSQVVYSSGYITFTTSYLPTMSGDLRVLDDGRVGMIATEGQPHGEIGNNQATFFIFAEQSDGQWLIDEVVLVNNSGEAPQG